MNHLQRPFPEIRGAAVRRSPAGVPLIYGETTAVMAEVMRARRTGEWTTAQPFLYQDATGRYAWSEIRYPERRRRPAALWFALGAGLVAIVALVGFLVWTLAGTILIALTGTALIVLAWRVLDRPAASGVSVSVSVSVDR